MEYFFDSDPGEGNGTPVPASTNTGTVSVNLSAISVADLAQGTHLFFLRAQDDTGRWGPARQARFVMPFAGINVSPVHIDRAEYFFDQDPGPGSGTPIPVPVDGLFDSLGEAVSVGGIDLSALPLGPHTLFVRMRGSDGTWGPARSAGSGVLSPAAFNFEVSGTRTVTALEYYVDTDPGAGNGTPLPLPTVTGSIFQSALRNLSTDLLSLGAHTLYLRARDGDGRWGPSHQRRFEIISTNQTISGVEYFVDTDPGVGAGTALSATDGAFDEGGEQVRGALPPPILADGSHQVFVRARSSTGAWSSAVGQDVTVGSAPAITSISPTAGVAGLSVTIAGSNFGPIQGGSTVTFNGAGAVVTSWSDTSIQATVPASATNGPVVVTVAGVASNGVTFIVSRSFAFSGNVYADRNGINGYEPGEGLRGAIVRLSPIQSCIGVTATDPVVADESGFYSFGNVPECTYQVAASWSGREDTEIYQNQLDIVTVQGAPVEYNVRIQKTLRINLIVVDFLNNRFSQDPVVPQDRLNQLRAYHRDNSKGLIDIQSDVGPGQFHYLQSSITDPSALLTSTAILKAVLCEALLRGITSSVLDPETIFVVAYKGNSYRAMATAFSQSPCSVGENVSAYAILVGYPDGSQIRAGEVNNQAFGTWAHEIGHQMGRFNRAYSVGTEPNQVYFNVPDLYDVGNVNEYDLMAFGSHTGSGTAPTLMSTFSRWFAGWESWNLANIANFPSASMTVMVPELSTSPLGLARPKIRSASDSRFLILEYRSKTTSAGNPPRDALLPNDGLVLYGLDEVNRDTDPRIAYWCRWSDPPTGPQDTFTLNLQAVLNPFESGLLVNLWLKVTREADDSGQASARIRPIVPGDFNRPLRGVLVRSWGALTGDCITPVADQTQYRPDIDLHVYTPDGRHVGWNYPKNVYEVGIEGAVVSGDMGYGDEWILVPANESGLRFVLTNRDGQLWSQEAGVDPSQIVFNEQYEVQTVLVDPTANIMAKSAPTTVGASQFGAWQQGLDETVPGRLSYTGSIPFSDTSAPMSTITISPAPNAAGWSPVPQTVSIQATDDVYVALTEYSLDLGLTWQPYSQPFVVSSTGVSQIQYRSYDNFGNIEAVKTAVVRIDLTPPSLPSIQDAGLYSTNPSGLGVTWSSSDPESGVVAFQYLVGTASGLGDVVTGTSTQSGAQTLAVSLTDRQAYFVCARAVNTAGLVSGQACTDGITFLTPGADPDGDGFTNDAEVTAKSDPFNADSRPGSTTSGLHTGFNLASFPAETLYYGNLSSLLGVLGGPDVISRVQLVDPVTKAVSQSGYDQLGHFFGQDIALPAGQGLPGAIIYAKSDVQLTFSSIYCSTWNLKIGINLVGTPCAAGLTAFQLLQAIGDSTMVSSIQRFNPTTGQFETAGYGSIGLPSGVNFPIVGGEGYVVSMKQERLGFRP